MYLTLVKLAGHNRFDAGRELQVEIEGSRYRIRPGPRLWPSVLCRRRQISEIFEDLSRSDGGKFFVLKRHHQRYKLAQACPCRLTIVIPDFTQSTTPILVVAIFTMRVASVRASAGI